ncbi:MAG: flagellar motor switch phosphatase FliY [Bacillota bacterium]
MSKEVLSQGEIEALLKTVEETGGEHFTDTEKEALIELTNLSIEVAVGALSALINRELEYERPEIALNRRSIVEKKVPARTVCLSSLFEGGVTGQALWTTEGALAAVLCDVLLGGDGTSPPEDLGETQLATLKEAFQNGLDAVADALGGALGDKIKLTAGAINAAGAGDEEVAYFSDYDPDHVFVELSGKLSLPDLAEGDIRVHYPAELARELLGRLTAQQQVEVGDEEAADDGEEAANEVAAGQAGTLEAEADGDETEPDEPELPPEVLARPQALNAKAQRPAAKPPRLVGSAAMVQVQPAKFESLKPSATSTDPQNIDLIMDVPLHLTVELGRTKMQVRQILALGTGAVIELDKLAGEPLDVLINGRLIAKGEVVIINENFGVRITDVVSQIERVQNLR